MVKASCSRLGTSRPWLSVTVAYTGTICVPARNVGSCCWASPAIVARRMRAVAKMERIYNELTLRSPTMRLYLVLLWFLAAVPAEAARVAGVVVDSSGAPVPGATVTAGPASMVTGDDGRFDLADAPDGSVAIRVTAPGFAVATLTVEGNTDGARVVLQPAPLVDEVVVTASRGAERLSTAAGTTVLTSAELLNSAAGALDDALRNTPGVSLFPRPSSRVSNPTPQGVTLRGVSGSGASRTMVLADGLPLNDPFGSWVYWNRIPQAAIDRIEVVRGATGDLYGADALGGVVQVLTFPPGRTRLRTV